MLEISYAWLETIVDVSIKSLLLAMAAGLALIALRVRDTNIRHRVWTAVLGGMLAMPLLSFALQDIAPSVPLPAWMTLAWQPSPETEVATWPPAATPAPVDPPSRAEVSVGIDAASAQGDALELMQDLPPFESLAESIPGSATTVAAAIEADAREELVQPATVPEGPAPAARPRRPWLATNWPLLLATASAIVSAVLFMRIVVGLALTLRLVRQARPLDPYAGAPTVGQLSKLSHPRVRLLEHPQIYVPLTIGFIRPLVLLPREWRSWSSEKREAVLAHELAHVRRRDWLVTLLAELNRAVYWFHPLAWLLKNRLAALAEQSCDDAVLEAHTDRAEYARYLLEVASSLTTSGRRCRAPLSGVAMARIPSVETRIDAILDSGRPLARRLGAIGVAVLLAVGIPAILLAAALRPASQGADQKSQITNNKSQANSKTEIADRPSQPAAAPAANDASFVYEGQVLTPDGKPAAGAKIFLLYKLPEEPREDLRTMHPLAETDADGNFRFDIKRNEFGDTREEAPWMNGALVATRKGYGFGWTKAAALEKTGRAGDGLSDRLAAEYREIIDQRVGKPIRLVDDDVPLTGRIVDVDSQPVEGANIRILFVAGNDQQDLSSLGELARTETADHSQVWQDIPGIVYGPLATSLLPAAKTDDQGRFSIHGVGRGRIAWLQMSGRRVEAAQFAARTEQGERFNLPFNRSSGQLYEDPYYAADFTHVAGPSRPVVGVVRDKDTKKPIADVSILCQQNGQRYDRFIRTRTDAQGKYELHGLPIGKSRIAVVPHNGEPYLAYERDVDTSQGKGPISTDFDVQRGIWVEGTVLDKKSGRPISGELWYYAVKDNPHYDPAYYDRTVRNRHRAGPDGRFRIPALPGRGLVTLFADQRERYPLGVGAETITVPSQFNPLYCNAVQQIEPPEDAKAFTVAFELSPGRKLVGSVVGPDGQHVADGYYIPVRDVFPDIGVIPPWQPLLGGKFAIEAYEPGNFERILFVDKSCSHAGVLPLDGEVTGELTARLQAAGTIRGRIVDEEGHPQPYVRITILLQPDPPDTDLVPLPTPLPPTADHLGVLTSYSTDAQGRFEIRGLIPALEYNLIVRDDSRTLGHFPSVLVVDPGEVRDLGDVALVPLQPPAEANPQNANAAPQTKPQSNSSVRVSQPSSREPVGTKLIGHNSVPTEIEFTPGGENLVSGDRTGVLIVWDVRSGRPLQSMGHEHKRWISALMVSPDGERIVSSAHDDSVCVWETGSGRQVFKLYGHGRLGGRYKVAIAPDGQTFASFGPDMYMRTWDMRTGKCLTEHAVRPQGMMIQEDEDGNVYAERTPLGEGTMFVAMQSEFSAEADLLLVPQGGDIHVFDVQSGEELRRFAPGGAAFGQFAPSPDGKLLVTTFSRRGAPHQPREPRTTDLRVIDFATNEVLLHRQLGGAFIRTIHFSPDGSLVGINSVGDGGERDEWTSVLRVESGDEIARVPGRAMEMAFSPDNGRLATSHDDSTVLVWDLAQFRTADN